MVPWHCRKANEPLTYLKMCGFLASVSQASENHLANKNTSGSLRGLGGTHAVQELGTVRRAQGAHLLADPSCFGVGLQLVRPTLGLK